MVAWVAGRSLGDPAAGKESEPEPEEGEEVVVEVAGAVAGGRDGEETMILAWQRFLAGLVGGRAGERGQRMTGGTGRNKIQKRFNCQRQWTF